MSLIKKLTPIEPDAIWIVRIIGVTLSIPLILLSIYCFVGIVNINNETDKMYADAGKARPTAEQVAASEAKQEHGSTFEYRKCDSKPDPFGIVCK